jgi:hypothetical protein
MNEIDLGVENGIRTIEVYDEEKTLIATFKRVEETEQ